jgi:hypothetical protein
MMNVKYGIFDSQTGRWLQAKPHWYKRTVMRLSWGEKRANIFASYADAENALKRLQGIADLEVISERVIHIESRASKK